MSGPGGEAKDRRLPAQSEQLRSSAWEMNGSFGESRQARDDRHTLVLVRKDAEMVTVESSVEKLDLLEHGQSPKSSELRISQIGKIVEAYGQSLTARARAKADRGGSLMLR